MRLFNVNVQVTTTVRIAADDISDAADKVRNAIENNESVLVSQLNENLALSSICGGADVLDAFPLD